MEVLRLVFLVSFFLADVYSKSIEKSDIVWFPNPNGDGSLIPAKLTPTPGALEGSPGDAHFYLYTKENKEEKEEISEDLESISNSHFLDGECLKLLVHGFGGGYDHSFPYDLRGEYVKDEFSENCNVILLEWSILADSPDYFMAFRNAQLVSEKAANFLKFLVENGKTSWDKIHLIGYSLGGQVVGQIGHKVQAFSGGEKIGRITALDPALPLFDVATDEERTSPDDAKFVDVIHTSANGILGYFDPLGHVDWYPNGGRYQPGCGVDLTGSCGHGRAPAMFIESVFSGVKFFGRKCDTYEDFEAGKCDSNPVVEMGHHTPDSAEGSYFLHSNAQSPFAQGPLER